MIPARKNPVQITKMSGAGNDFIVLGAEDRARIGEGLIPWTRTICRRGLSVGADGVLIVEGVEPGRVRMRYLNADGTPAFCGNGSRCAARFAFLNGLAGETMMLLTDAGEMPARIEGDRVHVSMPRPTAPLAHQLELGSSPVAGQRVLAGVPHFVTFVDDLPNAPLDRLGPGLRAHPSFGEEGTNVNLVQWFGDEHLGVRTFERGVEGETLSCGSGALAAAWGARLHDRHGAVRVTPTSGVELEIVYPDPEHGAEFIRLSGEARVVFHATVDGEASRGFA
ncbi:hypothetical protein ABI59_23840 [Acidobacteria bacterium Mor1]|nr:hypothetical protein ABI59_23840 [Acidobacteria bacterium Mor1]